MHHKINLENDTVVAIKIIAMMPLPATVVRKEPNSSPNTFGLALSSLWIFISTLKLQSSYPA